MQDLPTVGVIDGIGWAASGWLQIKVATRLTSLSGRSTALAAGLVSRRTVDLLGPNLPKILDEAEQEYGLIVVDAPPLLGFPEPLQMATVVDGVVIVSLAGQTNRKAIGSVMATLQRLRVNILGLVLNEVTHEVSDSYYYYGYYGKKYGYYKHYGTEGKG
jgi:Mrp family chromosome partitioning ATPase